MRNIARCSLLALACSALLTAQVGDGQRPEPDYDEVIAHLGLSDVQLDCLEANKDSFKEAVTPSAEQLRDLQRQLRQAARNGEDTAGIQAQIDSVRAGIDTVKAGFVASAQSCLDGGQTAALNDLIAAETLMKEVRQGIGLLLFESTEEKAEGLPRRGPARRRGRR